MCPSLREKTNRRGGPGLLVGIVLSAIGLLISAPSTAQESLPAVVSPGERRSPQDVAAELRASTDSFAKLRARIGDLWREDAEGMRGMLTKIAVDTELKINLFVALGWHFADENDRSLLDHFLSQTESRRLEKGDFERIVDHVIWRYHARDSVLERVIAHIESATDDLAISRLTDLTVNLVARFRRETGVLGGSVREGRERFQAMNRLIELWATREIELSEAKKDALRAAVAGLVDGLLTFDTPGPWKIWLAEFKRDRIETSGLSIEDVLRRILDTRTAEIEKLKKAMADGIREASQSTAAGKVYVPIDQVTSEYAELRDAAIEEVAKNSARLDAESRVAAVNRLLAAVERVRESAVNVAAARALGALVRPLPKDERAVRSRAASAVLAAIADASGKDAGVLLDMVIDIGVIDDVAAVHRIYERAARESSPLWQDIRSKSVKAAQLASDGWKVAVAGLTDPSPRVRAVAAVSLETLKDAVKEPSGQEIFRKLTEAALAESDPAARKRMFESSAALAHAGPAVAAGVAERWIGALEEANVDDVEKIARVLLEAATGGFLSDSEDQRLSSLVVRLRPEPADSEDGSCLFDLVTMLHAPPARTYLADWVVEQKSPSSRTAAILKSLGIDPKSTFDEVWTLARRIGEKGSEIWCREAVRLGERALLRGGATLAADLRGTIERNIAQWKSESGDVDMAASAVAFFSTRISAAPGDVAARAGRSAANELLKKWAAVEDDIRVLLAAEDLVPAMRGGIVRRGIRVRFALGDWSGVADLAAARSDDLVGSPEARLVVAARWFLECPKESGRVSVDELAVSAGADDDLVAGLVKLKTMWHGGDVAAPYGSESRPASRPTSRATIVGIRDDIDGVVDEIAGLTDFFSRADSSSVEKVREVLDIALKRDRELAKFAIARHLLALDRLDSARFTRWFDVVVADRSILPNALREAAESAKPGNGRGEIVASWLGTLPIPAKIVDAFLNDTRRSLR